ncbi:hypothetical protein M0Q97_05240 [Candidatus Dojkabacteria bacterium]|jgi:hypothetical protein|nr:hypothetical protein [Candidatus Dojkabacteria bacterium]
MNKIERFNEFYKQITEGLIKTYPIKTAIKVISRELSLDLIEFNIDQEEQTNTIFLKIVSSDIKYNILLKIIRQINLCGYFISNYDFYNETDNHVNYLIHKEINNEFLDILFNKIQNSFFTQITIESKFNIKVSIPELLYHVTLKSNKQKIKRIGLIPKSKNKKANHNDRIYFGYNPIIIKNLAYQFDDGDYILVEITTKNLNINIYDDPDFSKNGSYTYDNIPPDNIKIIDNFKVKR